jgi:hypothetical protein
MLCGSGKYLKTVGGRLHFARLDVEAEVIERAEVAVECSATMSSEMGWANQPGSTWV